MPTRRDWKRVDESRLRGIKSTLRYHSFEELDPESHKSIQTLAKIVEQHFKNGERDRAHILLRPLYKITRGMRMIMETSSFLEGVEKAPLEKDEYKRLKGYLKVLETDHKLNNKEMKELNDIYGKIKMKWVVIKSLKEITKSAAYKDRVDLSKIKEAKQLIEKDPNMAIERLKEIDPAFREISEITSMIDNMFSADSFDVLNETDWKLVGIRKEHNKEILDVIKKKAGDRDPEMVERIIEKINKKETLSPEEKVFFREIIGFDIEGRPLLKKIFETLYADKVDATVERMEKWKKKNNK